MPRKKFYKEPRVITLITDASTYDEFHKWCRNHEISVSKAFYKFMLDTIKKKREEKKIESFGFKKIGRKIITTFYLDEGFRKALDKVAEEIGKSRGEVLEEITHKFLIKDEKFKECPICHKKVEKLRSHLTKEHKKEILLKMKNEGKTYNEAIEDYIQAYLRLKR